MNEILHQVNEKYIPFWLGLRDKRGGFYGEYNNGVVGKEKPKGAAMHLQSLWFLSRAFQAFKNPAFKEAADSTFRFIVDHFVDKNYGGLIFAVRHDGLAQDTIKHASNFALGIYAFTAYFDISSDYQSLKFAYECFNTIEIRCKRLMGYREQFDQEFTPMENSKVSTQQAERNAKTMLQILEAYVDFYHRTKDENVKTALNYIYDLIKFRVYDTKSGSLDVFMDDELDTEYEVTDFGLNLWGSWQLTNAATALGTFEKDDAEMIKTLVDNSIQHGFDGNAFIYRKYGKKADNDRLAWVQAEGIVALLNAYSLTKNEKYLDKAKTVWYFIKDNLIADCGAWYWGKSKEGKILTKFPLASSERGPYHEGRMFLEVLRRGINIGL